MTPTRARVATRAFQMVRSSGYDVVVQNSYLRASTTISRYVRAPGRWLGSMKVLVQPFEGEA